MRMSQLWAPTLRDDPQEAELASHRLMIRAGLIRRSAAGFYSVLPLGWRAMLKVMAIIREEMNRQGAQELVMPIVQPAELWRRTGRWEEYGDDMFRLKDRHGREFCLGPTHEEIITALVRADVSSYRQLPLLLYQIQNKYRDEIRPRFGMMRAREFIMKDLYSFDRDEAGLDASYEKMYEAYRRAFARCGLQTYAVEADPGAIGGTTTHEFMVLADAGEDEIVFCSACDYAANVERAGYAAPPAGSELSRSSGDGETDDTLPPAVEPVDTPGVRTIEELEQFLGIPAHRMLKTMLYMADGQPVAVVVRGDHQVNEVKVRRYLQAQQLVPAEPEDIQRLTGAAVGFAGPVGLAGVRIIADWSAALTDAVAGANETDRHLLHVTYGRDWTADTADLRVLTDGDPCPRCSAPLKTRRGIEVGHLFKLGTRYSEQMGATFLDEDGEARPFVMGCYGIGVGRTLAAVIEQHHDERGIRWPVSVAPYEAIVVPVNYGDEQQRQTAETLYQQLQTAGVEVVLDDRDERAGVKFNDADLIGFPLRITIGPRALKEGCVELHWRFDGAEEKVPVGDVVQRAQQGLRDRTPQAEP